MSNESDDYISKPSGSRKRPVDVENDGKDDPDCPTNVSRSATKPKDTIIEPIRPNPNYFIQGNNAESKRYIIYMAVREYDSCFSDGLSKCLDACTNEQVQSCLQFDGTRHITMFDGFLTNECARNLSYRYNRFEDGKFNPIKLKIEGWMPWEGGCYLKVKSPSEKMLAALLRKVDGFPDQIKRSLLQKDLPKNGKFKFPCNHLSVYRLRPNVDRSKAMRAFESIVNTLSMHDWGCVEGVGVRLKVMGDPYTECKVLAGI